MVIWKGMSETVPWTFQIVDIVFISHAEITLAFEGDGPIIIKSNGPLGRGMGAPWFENDFQQFKQF